MQGQAWLLGMAFGGFARQFCPAVLPDDFAQRLGAFEPAGQLIVGDDAVKFLDFPFGSTRIDMANPLHLWLMERLRELVTE